VVHRPHNGPRFETSRTRIPLPEKLQVFKSWGNDITERQCYKNSALERLDRRFNLLLPLIEGALCGITMALAAILVGVLIGLALPAWAVWHFWLLWPLWPLWPLFASTS
jgi:hypothetical protein